MAARDNEPTKYVQRPVKMLPVAEDWSVAGVILGLINQPRDSG